MTAIILDPHLAAVPPFLSTVEEFEDFLDRLLEWTGAILRDSSVEFVILEELVELLYEANCFPSGGNIEAALSMHNLREVYSISDIEKAINSIINRTKSLQKYTNLRVDFQNLTMDPNFFANCQDQVLRRAAEKSVAVGACCLRGFGRGQADVSFAPARVLETRNAKVVVVTNWLRTYLGDALSEGPCSVVSEVFIAARYLDIVSAFDARRLWIAATDDRELHAAIAAEAYSLARVADRKAQPTVVPMFHIGAGFSESLKQNAAWQDSTFSNVVRTACARVLLGNPSPPAKPFRVSADSDVQRTRRDGAAAYRLHITEGKEALRLMYWLRPDSTVEFSNIGPKREEWIDRSVTPATTSGRL